jgi:hypothetical protein
MLLTMLNLHSNWRNVSIAFLATVSVSVSAQEARQERGPWVWDVAAGAVSQLSADLSDGSGDVSITRGFVGGGPGYAWDRDTSISVSLGVSSADYDFSSDALIEGRKAWGRIDEYRLSVPMRFSPTEKMRAIIIPSIRTSAESGGSASDGRSEGVLAGFSWTFSDSLSIGPGFGWFSDVGDETTAFPIILVDWKITDTLSLTTGRALASSQGPGLSLDYKMDQKWSFGLTAGYEQSRFALDQQEGRVAQVGEDSSAPLLLVANYSPWPMTTLTAVVGAEFGGSLSLEDGRGQKLAETDVDTAMVIGLSFQSRF